MNETLGKIHFVGSLVCMNVVFMPMFLVGLAGVSRRLFDGGAAYDFAQPVLHLNVVSSWGAWITGALPDSLHLQFLLEHLEGGEDRREPVAGHDDRVGGSLASAARQFPRGAGSVPRALRVQRSRRGQGLRAAVRGLIRDGHSLHRRGAPRHRSDQRQDRHLALPGLGGHAVRRPVCELHPDPDGGAELAAGRHDSERPARHVQHDRPDFVLRHDGHGLGVADAPPLRDLSDLHGGDDPARVRLPRGQVLRIQPQVPRPGSFPAPTTSSPSTSP